MQVMVSDTGLYHGDMKQRASESMPFSRFLQAMRPEAAASAQHWYLAQVRDPSSPWSVDPAHCWPSAIMPFWRPPRAHSTSTQPRCHMLGPLLRVWAQHTAGISYLAPQQTPAALRPVNADIGAAAWPRWFTCPPSQSAAGPEPALVPGQAVISEGGSLNGRFAACGLHSLGADFNARALLALLTDEGAHSTNLWMQQRCHTPSIPCAVCTTCSAGAVRSKMFSPVACVLTDRHP